jgi:hypothetical protein
VRAARAAGSLLLTRPDRDASIRSAWFARSPVEYGATLAHYVSLIVALPVLLFIDRNQWFFGDEWDFLATRGLDGRALNLFVPHSEHWSTIPILVYRALFDVVALHSYMPYLAVLILVHIAVAHLVWRIMGRLGVDHWVATGLTVLFLFLGAGAEDLTWAFQIGFIGSVAFGLSAVLIVDADGTLAPRRVAAAWGVLVAGLMCSGVGVTMVAVAALTAALRHGIRGGVVTASVPGAVYLVWLVLVGRHGLGSIPITAGSLLLLPDYIWTGVTSTFEGISGLVGTGGVIALGTIAWLIWHRQECFVRPAAFAGAVGAIVFFAIDGVGRSSLGVAEVASSRYIYIAAALVLPVIGLMLTQVSRRDLLAQATILGLVAVCACVGLVHLWIWARDQQPTRQQSKEQILAAAQLLASGATSINDLPDPTRSPNLTAEELVALLKDGDLPSFSGVTAVDRLGALAALQTSMTASPLFPLGAGRITSVAGALASVGSDGCLHLQPVGPGPYALRLVFPSPSSLSLTSGAGETLQFFLQLNGASVMASPVNLVLGAGAPSYLNVLPANATPYIVAPASPLVVCGAASVPSG